MDQSFVLVDLVVAPAVELLDYVPRFATLCNADRQASLHFTISWSLLRLMSTEPVMPVDLWSFVIHAWFLYTSKK